jgi:hypothetical protein
MKHLAVLVTTAGGTYPAILNILMDIARFVVGSALREK